MIQVSTFIRTSVCCKNVSNIAMTISGQRLCLFCATTTKLRVFCFKSVSLSEFFTLEVSFYPAMVKASVWYVKAIAKLYLHYS